MIPVERKARHIVTEAQGFAFPTFRSMAFGTVVSQGIFVGVIFQVAGFAIILGRVRRPQRPDFCPIMAGVALCGQVLADQVVSRNCDVENVPKTRGLLRPPGKGVTSRATVPIIRGVLHFVARFASGRQPFEICGGEGAPRGFGLVAFQADNRLMLADQRVLRLLVVFELQPGNLPGHGRPMALRAGPLKLVPMGVFVAIRTLCLEVAELGRCEIQLRRSGLMTLLTRDGDVFVHEGELGVFAVIKCLLLLLPARGRMTGGAGGAELLPVRVLVTIFTLVG